VYDENHPQERFWESSFVERRCLVPATSFCEPNSDVKPVTWHWFAIKDNDPRPLFAFPGVWRRFSGPVHKDGPNVDIENLPDNHSEPHCGSNQSRADASVAHA